MVGSENAYKAPQKARRFLRPSERAGVVFSSNNPTWIRAQSRLLRNSASLPRFLPLRLFGLDASGAPAAIPAIDDLSTVPPPNLYVAFILQRMEHAVKMGGGAPQSEIFWQGMSAGTTEELSGPYSYPLPEAGETFILPSDHGSGIYQGFVLDGCSSVTLSFPVTLESWVVEHEDSPFGSLPTGAEIGRVTLTDYVIRGQGTNDGVSDFTISGLVYVGCNNNSGI